jgi:Fe-S cluster biogenesis protein NfuA
MGLLKRGRERGQAIEARIRDAIESLRPLLGASAASVELVTFESATGVATLRVDGDCPDCEMPVATFLQGIEAHLRRRVPEIREVRAASALERDG